MIGSGCVLWFECFGSVYCGVIFGDGGVEICGGEGVGVR